MLAQSSLADRLLGAPDRETASQILSSAAEPVDEALFQALRKSAQAHLDKREFTAAAREYPICLLVAEKLQSQMDMAASYLGLALTQARSGQFTSSLASYDKAYSAAAGAADKPLQATILRSRGVSYLSLGKFAEGLADSARSLALYRELKDDRGASLILNNMCGAQMVLGQLRQAAANCEEAYRLSRAFPDTAGVGIGNLGPILAQQGDYEAARQYLEQSIVLLAQQHDVVHLAGNYSNLGPVYHMLGDRAKALEAYSKAIEISHEAHDTANEAQARFNRAGLYAHIDPDKQEADLREGLRLQQQNESSYETVYGLTALANHEVLTNRVDEGCAHAAQALAIAQRFNSPALLWTAYQAAGYCDRQRKDDAKARVDFEQAVRYIESLRESSSVGDQEGQSFFLDKIGVYQELMAVLLDHNENAAALTVAERARARQLLDTSQRGKTKAAQSLTAGELAEEQRLSDDVAHLARRASAAPAAQRAEAQAAWDRGRRTLADYRGHLYASHPQLAITRGEAAPFALNEAISLLPDSRTLLVEFAVTRRTVRIFAIGRGSNGKPVLHAHTVVWDRDALVAAVSSFRTQLAARDLGYKHAAQSIYTKLLGPLEAELRGKDTLVLVPDAELWNLPFQALLRPDGAHLIEHQNVFYAPSLIYLRETRGRTKPGSQELLALGNPASVQLPNATREVRSLAQLYGQNAKVLTGGDATRQAWMSSAPDFRILHIATHGTLNPGNPMYSWLALAPGNDAGDGALEARDILPMNLHAEVAVLSACNTARGGVLSGEGLVGMSWAFLAAGAHSTVVSQWSVESAGTTELMLAFHKNLKPVLESGNPMGRARALQKAMLTIKAMPQYSHPFYWASFVMIGNGY